MTPRPFAGTDLDLEGRAACVTGASSGIGEAIARRLATAGAAVALVARRRHRLDELATTITAEGGRAVAVPADLSDPGDLDTVIDRAVEDLGALDVMVHAAGAVDHMPVAELDRHRFDHLVDVDLWAPLRLSQLARPHLARRRGVVVTIGSVDADRPSAGATVYGAVKAGLAAAVVALAKEWADDGIRVVQVDPGLVRTPLAAATVADVEASGTPVNLVGRVGEPDEVAALVHLLVSPAGAFATATRFRLDGGALATGPFDVTIGSTRPAAPETTDPSDTNRPRRI